MLSTFLFSLISLILLLAADSDEDNVINDFLQFPLQFGNNFNSIYKFLHAFFFSK